MKNTSDQKGRKLRSTTSINSLFKDARLKKQIEKVGGSYKCNLCKKSFIKKEEVRFHFFIFHNCCQTNSHEAQNLTTHNPPEKQNGADSNITLANVSNNKSKPSSDKTLSKEILEKEITKGLLNYADSNKTKVLEVKTLKCSDKKSDENHQNDSNTKLTAKDNCKVKAEKNDEFPKSDDGIEETHDWSVFIKDLKKNNKPHKLFEGMPKESIKNQDHNIPDYSKKQNGAEEESIKNQDHNIPDYYKKQNEADSNITHTNVSNSESKPSSDETLLEEMLSNKVQSNKSDEKNIQYIPDKSNSQYKKEIDETNKDEIVENEVVDVLSIEESDLPSNDETLSNEILSNKEFKVKIMEDSDFSILYQNEVNNIYNSPEKQNENDSNTKLDNDVSEPGPSNVKNDSVHVSNNESRLLSGKGLLNDIKSNKHKVPVKEESEKTVNTAEHEEEDEEDEETTNQAKQQKGQKGKTQKRKKSKKDNMEIIQDASQSSVILKCHICSEECDTPFEAYRHQNRKHNVEFAKDMKYYLNFSMRKTMTMKVDDGTDNLGLYIDIINIYFGENKNIFLKRKKLENWVQLGIYEFKDQKAFKYLYFLNDKNLKKITLKAKNEKKMKSN